MDSTVEFYNNKADLYFSTTYNICMNDFYDEFEKYIMPKSSILDLGCGSGRDSKYFIQKGYAVDALDASSEMCKIAEKYIGKTVYNMKIEDIDYYEKYDGIWACASLLHIQKAEMKLVLSKILRALKSDGILYASWKYGEKEIVSEGKYYCFMNEKTLGVLFDTKNVQIIKLWVTRDKQNRSDNWINIIAKKGMDKK